MNQVGACADQQSIAKCLFGSGSYLILQGTEVGQNDSHLRYEFNNKNIHAAKIVLRKGALAGVKERIDFEKNEEYEKHKYEVITLLLYLFNEDKHKPKVLNSELVLSVDETLRFFKSVLVLLPDYEYWCQFLYFGI